MPERPKFLQVFRKEGKGEGVSVSYLGVRLPKAENLEGPFVPSKELYADYIKDEFSVGLQRQIAISFLRGDPLLIEGGTSLGKTTAVKKMAADLGWEVHYANLNGATDVEDLMGRYIPNPNKKSDGDPDYIFADGKVTSGLRQEQGKIKVIILDEFNSAAPNILIRLHEVLDALNRGGELILSEDASESILVDKNVTKIVALTNPPGKGYFGREPIDPAQLRRWVYIKAPTDLPEKAFLYSTNALFSLVPLQENLSGQTFLQSREQALTLDQLKNIKGIEVVVEKYKEFHKAAKELVKERKIAADQPQPFTFDDRMEPKRVRDFILAFYDGDINQTIQEALRYYYANKLDSGIDKAKLEELIKHVEYIPQRIASQRRGFETEAEKTLARVEKEAWKKVLGRDVEISPLPDYVTPEVINNLKELGFGLRFIPKLDIENCRQDLERIGAENYLVAVNRRYPSWRVFETLDSESLKDVEISRNLEKWFWHKVRLGEIEAPSSGGIWLAVETMQKPNTSDYYRGATFINEEIGVNDRFGESWDFAVEIIGSIEEEILSKAGLPGWLEVRMPEALEWNLLANRERWGMKDSYDWTNTKIREDGALHIGCSSKGGAGYVNGKKRSEGGAEIGFRLAIVLGSPEPPF